MSSSEKDKGRSEPKASARGSEPEPSAVKAAPIIRGETEAIVSSGAPVTKGRDNA